MNSSRISIVFAWAAILFLITSGQARAVCVITGASASPLTASTGTYTPPNPLGAQATPITIQLTYLALLGGTCTLAMSFHRATVPASMALAGGGSASLPYTLQSSSSGGDTLFYTGGTPNASNSLIYSFNAPALGIPVNSSTTFMIYALAQPGNPQQAGSYQDSVTLDLFNIALNLLVTQVSSQAFLVTGQVAKSCTIGGVTHPSADMATIPITADGSVNTSSINRSYSNAICNTPTNVQLTSQNGAVVTGGLGNGLQRLIDYNALATFSGATASLNTAAVPGASGPESGTVASTTGNTPTGTLGVSIMPQLNTQPLVAGSYSDTLTITLTPQ
ncbi:hypothetical protein [Hyphomicrobium sp.]|jgi:hypothetical protein|uniref:hypothetical protein n=1 Tax=Hyphomicrobium sp. TaxID=82 RepID=UPI002B56CFE3|nr:hypothetical protein [Hyphomicrobium sp.]HVZ05660.1 hypothetical protein [Hyphomicrobium sp.]